MRRPSRTPAPIGAGPARSGGQARGAASLRAASGRHDQVRAAEQTSAAVIPFGGKAGATTGRSTGMTCPPAARHNQAWAPAHGVMRDVVAVDRATGLAAGHPWVTLLLDLHTRAITRIHVSCRRPSAASVRACLRCAIEPKDELLAAEDLLGEWPCMGVPERVILGGGTVRSLAGVTKAAEALGIALERTPCRTPADVAMEQLLWVTMLFAPQVPGRRFAGFFEGMHVAALKTITAAPLVKVRACALDWIVNGLGIWVHEDTGEAPFQSWAESVGRHGTRPPPDRSLRAAILRLAGVRAGRGGTAQGWVRACKTARKRAETLVTSAAPAEKGQAMTSAAIRAGRATTARCWPGAQRIARPR